MDIKQIFRVLLPHTVCNQICMAFIPGLASLWTNNEIFGTTYKHAWGKFYFRFLHYLIFSNLNLSSESEFRLSPFCPRCFACTVNCGSATRYHQISAIFQAFLLNFPLFFSLEVVQYLSNDRLVSFMGISPFLSLIYHIQNTINSEKLLIWNNKRGSSVARCWHAAREGKVQFPARAE